MALILSVTQKGRFKGLKYFPYRDHWWCEKIRGLSCMEVGCSATNHPPTHTLFTSLTQNRHQNVLQHCCVQETRIFGDAATRVEVSCLWCDPLGTLFVELAAQPAAAASSRDSIDRLSFCIDYTTCYSPMRAHCRRAKPDLPPSWNYEGCDDAIPVRKYYLTKVHSNCL